MFQQAELTSLHGDLARAQSAAEKGSALFAGRNPAWAWKFRLLQADILIRRGLSQDVLSLLSPPLPATLESGDLAVQRKTLQALAYAHLGRFEEAEQNLAEANELCQSSHCSVAGEVARGRGVVAVERDDLPQAEHFFRASLQDFRKKGDRFLEATALLNLGVVAMREQHYDESVDWSRSAFDVSHSLQAGLTEEKALGNLAWAYFKMGDFDQSLDMYGEAENRADQLGALLDQVRWLNSLGLVYHRIGQDAAAHGYYQKSLALARKIQSKAEIGDALTALAFLSVTTGQPQRAAEYGGQAFQMAHEENDRPAELYPLLAEGEAAARMKDTKRAEQVFTEVAKDPQSDPSLRWQAHNDLGNLYENGHRFAAAEAQYKQGLATLLGARSSIQHEEFRLPFLANAAHLDNDYIGFLVRQGQTGKALEVADASRAQTLMEGLGMATKSAPTALSNVHAIAAALGSTILFYRLGPRESYLWAVTSRRTELFRLPPESEIDPVVQRYRKAVAGPLNVLETNNPDGRQLYSTLIAPAEKLIPHNSRVLIIPDGSLNNLNFETLLVARPALHYWIEDVTVTNANSLRLLAAHRPPAKGAGKLLLIGDASTATGQFGELPNAGVEMESIENQFAPQARTVLARDLATPAAYLTSRPEQFAYIHFVAHGTASRLSPLDSAIVLSKSAPDDASKLYARDIIQHPLRADLVTISSCYGEGARAYTGEGLVGLSWAFLRAGAHNVIGALWEVSDTSTPHLMDNLYRELHKGASPAAALRNAKLEMLHSDGVFRKPYYWAPFQLYIGQ